MAAPVTGWIQLPSDTGNTGKKVRSQTRVVGADTVHEHFFVPSDPYNVTGMYLGHSGNLTIQATAQNGTATGFLWLINPAGSTIRVLLQRIRAIMCMTTNLSAPTAPRVVAQLFTYTGTPSGATITCGKTYSGFAAQQSSVRTAMTGMTITLGAIVWSTLPPSTSGTAAWTHQEPFLDVYIPTHTNDQIKLLTGEGICFYQPDAGTASDTRKLIIDLNIEEIEE